MPTRACPQCRRVVPTTVVVCRCGFDLSSSVAASVPGSEPERLLEAAQLYRRLILFVLLSVAANILSRTIAEAARQSQVGVMALLALVPLLVALGLHVASLVTTYRLASRLEWGLAWLWVAFMLVPCLNIFT